VPAGRAALRQHRRIGITPERLQDSLAERAAAFGREVVPFAVPGAFAVATGHIRATRGIGFLVRQVDRDAALASDRGAGEARVQRARDDRCGNVDA
jgi:hypothetical protein